MLDDDFELRCVQQPQICSAECLRQIMVWIYIFKIKIIYFNFSRMDQSKWTLDYGWSSRFGKNLSLSVSSFSYGIPRTRRFSFWSIEGLFTFSQYILFWKSKVNCLFTTYIGWPGCPKQCKNQWVPNKYE